jgi:phosphoketolase
MTTGFIDMPDRDATPLSPGELDLIHAWWRAANYLSVWQVHLVGDVIDRVPRLGAAAVYAKQAIRDRLIEHKRYITGHGTDMPEISNWRWPHEG